MVFAADAHLAEGNFYVRKQQQKKRQSLKFLIGKRMLTISGKEGQCKSIINVNKKNRV
jgi:hypothetical protein